MNIQTGKFNVRSRILCMFLALFVLSATTISCVSGGFRVTRAVAKWLNSQNIILRILLYILLWPVFIVTVILDDVIFNTVDFWGGTVTSQNEVIEKDGVRVEIAHTRLPLRRSVFTIFAKDGAKTVAELRETPAKTVEVYLNGVRKAEVQSLEDAVSNLVVYRADGTKGVERLVDPRDFADLERLPASQGAEEALARLQITAPNLLACSR